MELENITRDLGFDITQGVIALILFLQFVLLSLQLWILHRQGKLKLPRISCYVHNENDNPTVKGRWRFHRKAFANFGLEDANFSAFGLFIKNKSESPAYILRIKVDKEYENVCLLEETDYCNNISIWAKSQVTKIKWRSLRLYQPFSLKPFEIRRLLFVLRSADVDVNKETEVEIETSRGEIHKVHLQGVA